jgi:hypothetical protein
VHELTFQQVVSRQLTDCIGQRLKKATTVPRAATEIPWRTPPVGEAGPIEHAC